MKNFKNPNLLTYFLLYVPLIFDFFDITKYLILQIRISKKWIMTSYGTCRVLHMFLPSFAVFYPRKEGDNIRRTQYFHAVVIYHVVFFMFVRFLLNELCYISYSCISIGTDRSFSTWGTIRDGIGLQHGYIAPSIAVPPRISSHTTKAL